MTGVEREHELLTATRPSEQKHLKEGGTSPTWESNLTSGFGRTLAWRTIRSWAEE